MPANPKNHQNRKTPMTLALQIRSKTFNFKFRMPHNWSQFSLTLKLRRCRFLLKLKSVPVQKCWLKSKLCRIFIPFQKPKSPRLDCKESKCEVNICSLFEELLSTLGIEKGTLRGFLYFVNKIMFVCWTWNKLIVSILVCCWALAYFCGFSSSVLLNVLRYIGNAASSIGLMR